MILNGKKVERLIKAKGDERSLPIVGITTMIAIKVTTTTTNTSTPTMSVEVLVIIV